MALLKWYEMSCDSCRCAEHFMGTRRDAERKARRCGWVITKDGRHFDSKDCAAAPQPRGKGYE